MVKIGSVLLVAFLGMGAPWESHIGAAPDRQAGGKQYRDGHRREVRFPLGDISFADEVVSFEEGRPSAKLDQHRDPGQALRSPDYESLKKHVTLGCGGELTLRFTDNALVDVDGPDLHVFEVGPDIEPTDLSISEDGQSWVRVGNISGGRADVDINGSVKPGQIFHYVRLTDLKRSCRGATPGADIDAVGAIGSAIQMSLNAAVLFDLNQYTITSGGRTDLTRVIEQIRRYPGARVTISGHTDAVGTAALNQTLSENRASAVRDYLRQHGLSQYRIEANGHGATRPVATNASEIGRAKNRRVEIVVTPSSEK